jgi:hypothetical protein
MWDYNRYLPDEFSRIKKWVDLSYSVQKIDQWFIPTIQGLGRLDVELICLDRKYSSTTDEDERRAAFTGEDLNTRFTLSYLWVLGSYEWIRTLDKRCCLNPRVLNKELNGKIHEMRLRIERLRIPLAKMEPARRHAGTDAAIAYPSLHRNLGISWRVSAAEYICRREISDDIIAILEEIQAFTGSRFKVGSRK